MLQKLLISWEVHTDRSEEDGRIGSSLKKAAVTQTTTHYKCRVERHLERSKLLHKSTVLRSCQPRPGGSEAICR